MSRRDDLEFLKIQQTILQMEEDVKAWCPSSGENVGRMIESPGSDEWYIECPSIPAAHDLRAAYAETMEADVRHLRLRTGITVPCLIQDGVQNTLQDSGRDDDGATPVLLLHAWGESRHSFERLIPLLTGRRAYAPDLRGRGGADKPAEGYSLAEQAEDAAAILDALDVPRAAVVGSSSGGYVAQQLAVAHPEKVAALVLVGSPLSLRGRPPFANEVDALTDLLDEAWVRDSLSWFPGCTTSRPGTSRSGSATDFGCPPTPGRAS